MIKEFNPSVDLLVSNFIPALLARPGGCTQEQIEVIGGNYVSEVAKKFGEQLADALIKGNKDNPEFIQQRKDWAEGYLVGLSTALNSNDPDELARQKEKDVGRVDIKRLDTGPTSESDAQWGFVADYLNNTQTAFNALFGPQRAVTGRAMDAMSMNLEQAADSSGKKINPGEVTIHRDTNGNITHLEVKVWSSYDLVEEQNKGGIDTVGQLEAPREGDSSIVIKKGYLTLEGKFTVVMRDKADPLFASQPFEVKNPHVKNSLLDG